MSLLLLFAAGAGGGTTVETGSLTLTLSMGKPVIEQLQTIELNPLLLAFRMGAPVVTQTGVTPAPAALQVFDPDDLTTPVGTLDDLLQADWRHYQTDPGVGTVELPLYDENGDPNPNMPTDGQQVRVVLDGHAAYTFEIEGDDSDTIPENERAGQTRKLSGRGILAAEFSKGFIPPTRGALTLPREDVRVWSFATPNFPFATGWPTAYKVFTQGGTSTYYEGNPKGWTDPDAEGVWAAPGSQDDAEPGVSYLRWLVDEATYPAIGTATRILVDYVPDNEAVVYGDGQFWDSFQPELRTEGWRTFRTGVIERTPGDLLIGARVTNQPPTVIGANPAFFMATVYECDGAGLPTAVIAHTLASTVRLLGYPDTPPGWTYGAWLIDVLAILQAQGVCLDVVPDFTELVDSNGNPWITYAEIAAQVGNAWDAVRATLGLYGDVDLTPMKVLRAWNPGTRGGTTVNMTATTNPNTSPVKSLRHQHQAKIADAIYVRYGTPNGAKRDLVLPVGASTDPAPKKWATFDLGDVNSDDEALRLATDLLPTLAARTQADLQGVPTSGKKMYIDTNIGGTATVNTRDGDTEAQPIIGGFGRIGPPNGQPFYGPILGDRIEPPEQRLARAIKQSKDGTLEGRIGPATPAAPAGVVFKDPQITELPISITDVTKGLGAWPVERSGMYTRVKLRPTPATGDNNVTLEIDVNGLELVTVTSADGNDEQIAVIPVGTTEAYVNPGNYLEVPVPTTGDDVEEIHAWLEMRS